MSRRRVSCAVLMVIGFLAPARASAQPGQPVDDFDFQVENGTVTMEWRNAYTSNFIGGYMLYASYSQGGPIIAQQYIPAVMGVDGIEPPFVRYPVVPPGTYYVIVVVDTGPPTAPAGEWTRIDVGPGCTTPPNPPGLSQVDHPDEAYLELRWAEDEDGCPAEGFVLEAGNAPGLANLAIFPVSGTSFGGYVPAGTYYLRLRAANRFGGSAPSEEIVATIQGCSPPGPPIGFSATVTGHTVQLTWSPPVIGGAYTGYILAGGGTATGPVQLTLGAQATSLTVPNVPSGTYSLLLVATTSCPSGVGFQTPMITVVVP